MFLKEMAATDPFEAAFEVPTYQCEHSETCAMLVLLPENRFRLRCGIQPFKSTT